MDEHQRKKKPPKKLELPLPPRIDSADQPISPVSPPSKRPKKPPRVEKSPIATPENDTSMIQGLEEDQLPPTPALDEEDERYCTNCGAPLPNGSEFCEKCGW